MKLTFRLYRRGRRYYAQNNETGQQVSLHTSDKAEATRLLNAKNEAPILMGTNMQVARAYMAVTDPHMPKRIWKEVVDFIIDQKEGPNKKRWVNVSKDKALKPLWKMRVVETRADQMLVMLKKGTVSTNVYLRRLHNFALDMNWLGWPILPKKLWPKVEYAEKRGITREEHLKIIAAETNPERRDFYELLWFLGSSQTDLASLRGEDVNWKDRLTQALVGEYVSVVSAERYSHPPPGESAVQFLVQLNYCSAGGLPGWSLAGRTCVAHVIPDSGEYAAVFPGTGGMRIR